MYLPKPDWYKLALLDPKEVHNFGRWSTLHGMSTRKEFPHSDNAANKHPKTTHKPSFKPSACPTRPPHAKVSDYTLAAILTKIWVLDMLQK
jgi:hypothetical protein